MNAFLRQSAAAACCGTLCVFLYGCSGKDPAGFDRAAAAAEAGEWNVVIAELPSFIDDFPDDGRTAGAYLTLGDAYEKLRRWTDALRTYETVMENVPSAPAADSAAVRIRDVRAMAGSLKGEGDFQGAAAVYRALLALYPADPRCDEWQVALGFCSELAGDWQDAVDAYRGFLARNPEGETADEVRHVLVWLEPFSLMLLEDFRGAADYRAAVGALEEFRKAHPGHPRAADALFWIGYAYEYNLDAPDMAAAVRTYGEFRTAYPEHPYAAQALYQTGHCYQNDLDDPRPEKAVEVFDDVVARYPGTEWAERALFAKADICERQLRRYEDALGAYAAVLNPEYMDESRFQKFLYARVRMGCIYKDHLNDFAMARKTFERILEIDPDGWYSGRVDWQMKLMDMKQEGRI